MPKHTLLQITDTHLSADADAQMQGINTSASLAKVISHARAQGVDFDAVLATGDISQDGSAESYDRFLELTSVLQPTPLLWLPGNHDNVARMAAARTESPSSLQLGSWLVLMLDSTVAGSPHGELGQQRLENLRTRLADAEEQPEIAHVILAVHHNPQPNGASWMDEIGLHDGAELLSLLNATGKVRALLHGHCHQALDEVLGQVRVLGAPSTCVQFAPIALEFAVDSAPPGYRWLRLHEDGKLETGVVRVPDAGRQT